ncbi:YidC/Oxa1 family membrane protein insertase [Streptococcus rupicaprae]|uniref:Membrane protein insertase YidC n=1 Tax=Streptococcus rupicaprae TaxID=759619 RepID=A0ABV2FLH8_9STRE
MKKKQILRLLALTVLASFFLAGCVATKNGVPTGEGWVYNLLVKPMGQLITYFAKDQGFGYGIGIILTTLVVRLLIFPLGLYQAWKASEQAVRREHLKPILDPIQERLKTAKDPQEQMMVQRELMAVQKENGVSMLGGVGCLPLLIQMPFFTAIFYAARYTTGISEATFLGINLGKPSLILTAIVGVLYFLQSYLSMQAVDPQQREQMKTMMYMSPVMITVFSLTSPAGVTLYWVIGGVIQVLQQIIINFFVRPYHKRKIAEEFAKNPPKARPINTSSYKKDVTPQAPANQAILPGSSKKKRNAGKQRSR